MDNEPPTQKRRKVNQTNAPWRVAVVGSLIVLFATSVFGTSGLFYVYFMDTFGVSHEAASWPASTMAAMLNCAGLVVSLLQRFLSIFQISLVGSVLLWTSLMLAAFAPNMEIMTLLLGAVHGLGLGFVENTVSVIIATSFQKHKSFSMGFKDSGRTLSVLIFPTVVSYFNSLYGIRSTLALCGALLMHVTALVLTLRRHPFTERPCLRRNSTGSKGQREIWSLLISATASFSPVLITDYLGACRVPITCGVSGLVTGPLLLATPSITGFFRDTKGSYDSLVRLIAGLAATSATLILLLRNTKEKLLNLLQTLTENFLQTSSEHETFVPQANEINVVKVTAWAS
ncbi:hypothetical protein MRX96_025690 [Rhipicephalus microplus]